MTQRLALLVTLATSLLLLAYLATSFADEAGPVDWTSLEIQYAKANLELAQAQMAVAEFQNQEAAQSVPQETVDSLRTGVLVAQDRLRSLQGDGEKNPYAALIVAAQAAVNGAEAKYQESLQANSVDQGTISTVMLRREQAEIAVAKARLAMLMKLNEQTVDVRLQWEIRQLQDEVRALWNRPMLEE